MATYLYQITSFIALFLSVDILGGFLPVISEKHQHPVRFSVSLTVSDSSLSFGDGSFLCTSLKTKTQSGRMLGLTPFSHMKLRDGTHVKICDDCYNFL